MVASAIFGEADMMLECHFWILLVAGAIFGEGAFHADAVFGEVNVMWESLSMAFWSFDCCSERGFARAKVTGSSNRVEWLL